MTAGVANVVIEQGATWRRAITYLQPVTNLDPQVTLAWQGIWSSTEAYAAGALVYSGTSYYYAPTAVVAGTAPPASPWVLIPPYDVTGCTARMDIRSKAGAPDSAVPPLSPIISVTETLNASGQITVGGADGRLDVWLKPDATLLLTGRRAAWDLYVTPPGGDTVRVVQGAVTISKTTTRPTHA